eukprot:g18564.t1
MQRSVPCRVVRGLLHNIFCNECSAWRWKQTASHTARYSTFPIGKMLCKRCQALRLAAMLLYTAQCLLLVAPIGGSPCTVFIACKTSELRTLLRSTAASPSLGTGNRRASNWQMSLEMLALMGERKLQQDSISFHAAISACERGNCWREALELLKAWHSVAVKSGSRYEPPVQAMQQEKLAPEITGCNAVISACEKSSQWQQALIVLSAVRQMGLQADVVTFNGLTAACQSRSSWQTIHSLFEDMHLHKLESDVITFNSAIRAHEHWPVSLSLQLLMATKTLPSDIITCNSVLEAIPEDKWQVLGALLLNFAVPDAWLKKQLYS